MPTSPAPNRQCPNCGAAITPGLPCKACGFDPRAGVVRRHTPEQTRGLNAIAMKFGLWSFAAAALIVGATVFQVDDIMAAEATGGTFSADPFTGMIYQAVGLGGVVAFWAFWVVVMLAAGFRALSLRRAGAN